ncbi:MAG: phosphonate ABC transporter ATP-binding protein [Anaerolineae bacterium]|nr:phosphonate ABC transporter ATP-binding protein [Anaerolineae bacterium]
MLRVVHLTKIYSTGTRALDDVSFEVADGEFLAIIGLSGSGKSTLLRCINRLVEPTSGEIWLDDSNITAANRRQLRSIRRRIGMVFQQFNLVKRSTVLTNVLAGRLGYTSPWYSLIQHFSKEDYARARKALQRVGIGDKGDNRADELSGGQQQRVGIARALMQTPSVILADEPVASLDPVLAHSILGTLEQLNKQDKITVLCSLHHLDLVQRYATRIIGLRDGKIVYTGDRDAIRKLTDEQFKEIYGEEAIRLGSVVGEEA